jgi:HAMP domain-containing protein
MSQKSQILTKQDIHDAIETSPYIKGIEGSVRTEVGSLRTEVGSLRTEVGSLRTEVGSLSTEVGSLRTDVRHIGVLLESMDKKIDLALDISKMTTQHMLTLNNHEYRIQNLESTYQGINNFLNNQNK